MRNVVAIIFLFLLQSIGAFAAKGRIAYPGGKFYIYRLSLTDKKGSPGTLANPEKFAYVGSFSSGAWNVDQVKGSDGFAKNVKLLFMSGGGKENMGCVEAAKNIKEQLGVNAVGYESPGTAHEWHTWRRSLYQFAQLIFK